MSAPKVCVLLAVIAALCISSYGAPVQVEESYVAPAADSISDSKTKKTRSAEEELTALEQLAGPLNREVVGAAEGDVSDAENVVGDVSEAEMLPSSEVQPVEPLLEEDAPAALSQELAAAEEEEEEREQEEEEKALDLTPLAVAQYLVMTGDFSGFAEALEELISTNVVQPDDARLYRDQVGLEYERLMQELAEEKMNQVEESVSVPEEEEEEEEEAAAAADGEDYLNSLYPSSSLSPDAELAIRRMQLEALIDKEATLDELLQTLVEEYILKGIQAADSREQAELAESLDSWELEQLIEMMAKSLKEDEVEAALGQNEAIGEDALTSSDEVLPSNEEDAEQEMQSEDEEQQLEKMISQEFLPSASDNQGAKNVGKVEQIATNDVQIPVAAAHAEEETSV